MLQLNPAIPLWHVPTKSPCYAYVLIDYSQDHDLLWVCVLKSGEIWAVPNKDLRGQENFSLGRPGAAEG